MLRTIGAAALAAMTLTSSTNAGEPIVRTYKFNPVQKSRDLTDVASDCLRDKICGTAVQAVASYVGVSSSVVQATKYLIKNNGQVGNSEEYKVYIASPRGYALCRLSLKMQSINPPETDRAAHFSLQGAADRFQIYAWVPRRGPGGGRTFIDSYIHATYIPAAEYAAARQSGVCQMNSTQLKHLTCRGSRSFNKGLIHGFPGCPGSAEVTEVCPSNLCRRY